VSQLADFEKIEEVPLPNALKAEIAFRPYQQHGYNWLMFLRKFGLNGILADDMGLGKTLQTLAAIRMEQERSGGMLPSLVVCPTSLVANWKAEASKFFDGFNIITYTGPGRKRQLQDLAVPIGIGAVSERMTRFRNRLVITSYGVALRDHEELNSVPWMYVVVDEAHHIKNPAAQRTRAIKTINGSHKLALTGTPIQNNLDELWSLFDFAMPNYLGSRGKFRQEYGNGNRIDWEAVRDEERGLKRRIHPFILRRLKEDVAADLPDKVVIDLPVELSPKQVSLYKATLQSADFQKLVEAVETKGSRRASAEMLAIYTRLRTICNHPVLASHEPQAFRPKDSGKLQALKELIEEVFEGGHRALIFCQSTKMLDLIGRCFAEWEVESRRLDGETPPARRQELVDEFNRDASIVAFLISTKAGGTGLNLTGADTVIFYDHDWNPANDRQAQDRAYRIGQTRNVTVYRLVSVGTIEERIIERQELKQSLADQVIGVDSEGFKELTKEQLISLFGFRG
jgi:SNF2 family DNA or RNA helicase